MNDVQFKERLARVLEAFSRVATELRSETVTEEKNGELPESDDTIVIMGKNVIR
jgi:hypothetical protein